MWFVAFALNLIGLIFGTITELRLINAFALGILFTTACRRYTSKAKDTCND